MIQKEKIRLNSLNGIDCYFAFEKGVGHERVNLNEYKFLSGTEKDMLGSPLGSCIGVAAYGEEDQGLAHYFHNSQGTEMLAEFLEEIKIGEDSAIILTGGNNPKFSHERDYLEPVRNFLGENYPEIEYTEEFAGKDTGTFIEIYEDHLNIYKQSKK